MDKKTAVQWEHDGLLPPSTVASAPVTTGWSATYRYSAGTFAGAVADGIILSVPVGAVEGVAIGSAIAYGLANYLTGSDKEPTPSDAEKSPAGNDPEPDRPPPPEAPGPMPPTPTPAPAPEPPNFDPGPSSHDALPPGGLPEPGEDYGPGGHDDAGASD